LKPRVGRQMAVVVEGIVVNAIVIGVIHPRRAGNDLDGPTAVMIEGIEDSPEKSIIVAPHANVVK